MITKIERRARIKMRIRKVVNGTADMPRLTVFRSNKQIYAQVVDDSKGVTLCSASSMEDSIASQTKGKTKVQVAELVGSSIAIKATGAGVSAVAFDRNGYLFHGRVKQLADAARKGGLKF